MAWLLRSQRVPGNTAMVLSKLSFQLLIPCLMYARVSHTLITPGSSSLLLVVVGAALAQAALGAACGALLAPAVTRRRPRGLGLWPRQDRARAIAASVATAGGFRNGDGSAANSDNTSSLLVVEEPAPPRGAIAQMVMACAFGNSFTLPALLFSTLLSPATAERAVGLSALFLLAMDSLVWSVCMPLMQGEEAQEDGGGDGSMHSGSQGAGGIRAGLARVAGAARAVINPPNLAMAAGVIVGLTPKLHFLLLGGGPPAAAAARAVAKLPFELGLTTAALRCVLEAAELMASSALGVQVLVLASSLVASAGSGAALRAASQGGKLGLEGQADVQGSAGAAAASPASQNPGGQVLFNTATKMEEQSATDSDDAGNSDGLVARCVRWAATALAPVDGLEGRMMLAIGVTRFLIVPGVTAAVLKALAPRTALLRGQPLLLFVLLLQSAMPPAQNIVLLLQLCEATRPAAPGFARLLLKLYGLGATPVTLWAAAFAGMAGLRGAVV